MSKSKKTLESIQKENILQAVLIADDFDGIFDGFVKEDASVLLPVVNIPILDYALESLERSSIQETILFCSSNADVIKTHMKDSKWCSGASSMSVSIVVSERCLSLGDALRDLDHKAVIRGDFVLLSTYSVSNLNLKNLLEYHRGVCQKDKGAAMTLIMQDVGSSKPKATETIVAINKITNRLLFHSKPGLAKKIQMPLEYLLDHAQVQVMSNHIDSGVAICSPSVPLLFSDNFDFQTKDDFIRGLLLNEEILASRIYCWQGGGHGYGQTVRDWRSYQQVSRDIIHRFTFPLVPDQPISFTAQPFVHYRNGIYKQPAVQLGRNCNLLMDVVIGQDSQLGNNVTVTRSVIGKNCKIGNNVIIKDSYIFNNVVIEDNANVELTVLGEEVHLKQNTRLKMCIVKFGAVVEVNANLQDCIVLKKPLDDSSGKKLSNNAYSYPMRGNPSKSEEQSDEDDVDSVDGLGQWACLVDPDVEEVDENDLQDDSESDDNYDDNEHVAMPELDDTKFFYSEVLDSIQRGFEEKFSCENLILEINSSRYAYNVTLSEVRTLTVKAILALRSRLKPPDNAAIKPLLIYFEPLLKNYIKSAQAQCECLEVFEEMSESVGQEMVKCLHYLYDKEILSEDTILEWYEQLKSDSSMKPKVAPLVKWLEQAAEESSSDSE